MKNVMRLNLDRAFRYALHMLGNAERAEDAVQEACLRCLRRAAVAPKRRSGAPRRRKARPPRI